MASLNRIDRAQQMYREGRYEEALGFFTEALSMAKTNPQRISLHSNRAACYLKLQHFNKAAEECTSVLELDQNHTGALMLRAQTLVTLKEYRSSLFDVNRLIELNPSSEVYHNLEARLRTQLSLAPIPESEVEWEEEEEDEESLIQEQEREYEEAEQFSNERKEERSETKEVVHQNSGVEEVLAFEIPIKKVISLSPEQVKDQKPASEESKGLMAAEKDPKGWQSIPKPKGHATLDYARWDRVEDDSSGEDSDSDSDEDSRPQYRFRLKTVGVRPVK